MTFQHWSPFDVCCAWANSSWVQWQSIRETLVFIKINDLFDGSLAHESDSIPVETEIFKPWSGTIFLLKSMTLHQKCCCPVIVRVVHVSTRTMSASSFSHAQRNLPVDMILPAGWRIEIVYHYDNFSEITLLATLNCSAMP